jgi:hypothetical protein
VKGGAKPPAELLAICEPCDLPSLYQTALSIRPRRCGAGIEWISDKESRRDAGSYFTPLPFVRKLLDFGFAGRSVVTPTICDPSCGAGAFLIEAAKHLAELSGNPIQQILDHSIFGCDNDPIAIALCKLMIWLETAHNIPDRNLICADALATEWCIAFPQAFADGGFDLVAGNPPFGGVVDGRVPEYVKGQRGGRFPELGGTADLSYYFAALAVRLAKPDGRVALVLPRAFISASSTSKLRNSSGHQFVLVESAERHDSFEGAAVHVCLAGFTRGAGTRPAITIAPGEPEKLSVTASMTVGEAYDIALSVVDQRDGNGPKLLTTGLIDPGRSMWGEVTCRYLKSQYQFPRVPSSALPQSRRMIAKRPKVLVAGLSRTIECFLDEAGEYAGTVGTYTVTHPEDDPVILRKVMRYLHSPRLAARFRSELGASALGGGNITLTRRFLRQVLAEGKF